MSSFQVQNFETELDRKGVSRIVVSESLRTTPGGSPKAAHRIVPMSQSHLLGGAWDAKAMLDFLSNEMTQRFGAAPIPRAQGAAVCKRFISTWGPERSEKLCRYVVDNLDGMWLGEKITIGRFSKKSDPYFAQPIFERLNLV